MKKNNFKSKYKFDPVTLKPYKVQYSVKDKFLRTSVFVLAIVFGSFIFYLFFSSFYDSPKERFLGRENSKLKTQYSILDKKLDRLESVLRNLENRDNQIYRTIFEADPVPASIRKGGYGGVNRYKELEGYENSDLIIKTNKKIDNLTKQVYIQSKSFDEVYNLAINKEHMLSSIPAIQPVRNKDLKRIASGFGMRIDPHYKVRKMHEGMDFSAPKGTPIYSTGDGIILRADRKSRGFGWHVRVNHGFGYVTLYGHMSKILVKPGQKVKRGDTLGLVGNTGKSKGPHCHYEVRKDGIPINPVNFYFNDLTPQQYSEILKLAERQQQSLD